MAIFLRPLTMTIKILAPTFPEGVTSAKVSDIYVAPGAFVYSDDVIFDIETNKAILEIVAPANGVVTEYFVCAGEEVSSNQVIAHFLEKDALKKREISDNMNGKPVDTLVSPKVEYFKPTSMNVRFSKIAAALIVGTLVVLTIAYIQFAK